MEASKRHSNDPDIQMVLDEVEGMRSEFRILDDKFNTVHDKLLTLPCNVHVEKFKSFDSHILDSKVWRGVVITIFLAVIGFAVAWGVMQEKVNSHIEFSTKAIEHCCVQ